MDAVRIGIVGIGNMGAHYLKTLAAGEVDGARPTAVCDTDPARLEAAKARKIDGLTCFTDYRDMIGGKTVDGIIIATPHYDHPAVAIAAFDKGLHVLCEKPAGVYTRQVRAMNEAAARGGTVFGMMFNQRTSETHQKMKELVTSGELGAIVRVNWIITDWFRSQSYYDGGGWRATWAGEGGGVLVNQTPHQLDLWQWICGMPKRVRGFCRFGKHHNIEVEDEVTVFAEYESGATAVFIASTGEAPGTNRFEIVGDRGRLVLEEKHLVFLRNRQLTSEFLRTSKDSFKKPEVWRIELATGDGEQHKGIIKNWVSAIRKGTPLQAPGSEGIRQVELANAIMLSGWTDEWVTLPIDEARFETELRKRIESSTYKKPGEMSNIAADLRGSF